MHQNFTTGERKAVARDVSRALRRGFNSGSFNPRTAGSGSSKTPLPVLAAKAPQITAHFFPNVLSHKQLELFYFIFLNIA